MYVADNDGFLPTETAWRDRSIPSLPTAGCPAAEAVPALDPPLPDIGKGLPGYAFNRSLQGRGNFVDGWHTDAGLALARVSSPRLTIAVFDYTSGLSATSQLDQYRNTGHTWPRQLTKGWTRHNNAGNYLFVDGHVARFAETAIYVPETDFCTGDGKSPMFCR